MSTTDIDFVQSHFKLLNIESLAKALTDSYRISSKGSAFYLANARVAGQDHHLDLLSTGRHAKYAWSIEIHNGGKPAASITVEAGKTRFDHIDFTTGKPAPESHEYEAANLFFTKVLATKEVRSKDPKPRVITPSTDIGRVRSLFYGELRNDQWDVLRQDREYGLPVLSWFRPSVEVNLEDALPTKILMPEYKGIVARLR